MIFYRNAVAGAKANFCDHGYTVRRGIREKAKLVPIKCRAVPTEGIVRTFRRRTISGAVLSEVSTIPCRIWSRREGLAFITLSRRLFLRGLA